MIEVYKTNIRTRKQSSRVLKILKNTFLGAEINFDLEDCDKILRVKGIQYFDTNSVVDHLIHLGYECEILE